MKVVPILLIVTWLSSPALAQPGRQPERIPVIIESEVERDISYRKPIAIIDSLAIGSMWLGTETLSQETEFLIPTGIITHVFAAPIIHLKNGSPGKGLASLALRLMLPTFTSAVAVSRSDCLGCDVELGRAWTLGAAVASLIDISLLATSTQKTRLRRYALPQLAPVRGGAIAGLQGAF